MTAEQFFMSALENGSRLMLNPSSHIIPESTIKMFADSYHATSDDTGLPKRSFHNIGHPLETSAKAFPGMETVHATTKTVIEQQQSALSGMAEPDRQHALGMIYKQEVEKAFPDPRKQKEIALVDQAALAHDVVYHTDKTLHPSVAAYLLKALEKNPDNPNQWQWSAQGKEDYPMLHERLSLVKNGTGPYADPLMNSATNPNNELLSTIIGAIKTREAGLGAEAELINTHIILATIPFRSQEKENALLNDTATIAKKYHIDETALTIAETAGQNFTNGADIRAFVMQSAELDAHTPKGTIKVGFAATEHTMSIENNVNLRNPLTSTGYDHAAVGSAGFYRMMAGNVEKGDAAVFHGTDTTPILALDNTPISVQEANKRAAANFTASAEIIEARQVTGFLVAAFANKASGKTDTALATVVENIQLPQLRKVGGATAASPAQLTILNNPDAQVTVNGKLFNVGDKADPLAARLLDAVGPDKMREMSGEISKVMNSSGPFPPPEERIENIFTHQKALLTTLTASLGKENMALIDLSVSTAAKTRHDVGLTANSGKMTAKSSQEPSKEAGGWQEKIRAEQAQRQTSRGPGHRP